MQMIWVLIKKELKQYFTSPIAYVVMMIYLTLSGFFFFTNMQTFSEQYQRLKNMSQYMQDPSILAQFNLNGMVIAPALGSMLFVFLYILPLIMMRSLAEEEKQKTDELLRTSPITVNQVIAGKFLGSLSFVLIMFLPTLIFMGLLFVYASPEWGPLLTGYLGLALFAGVGVSIGLFASSLTENQIIAAVISFVILMMLLMVDRLTMSMADRDMITSVLSYLSIGGHVSNMLRGVIDSRDIIYFLSFMFFFLFLTRRTMEAKGWR